MLLIFLLSSEIVDDKIMYVSARGLKFRRKTKHFD